MSKGSNSSVNNLSDEDQIRQMEIEWGDAFLRLADKTRVFTISATVLTFRSIAGG
jgi:hypothetical protein